MCGLNSTIKRQRLTELVKKTQSYATYKKLTSPLKMTESEVMEKDTTHK
jgi:hypothetical protein